MSVVSCGFPNSITTTCYGLVGRVANKSVTSSQPPCLRGSYGETCVIDFGQNAAVIAYMFPVVIHGLMCGPLLKHVIVMSALHDST